MLTGLFCVPELSWTGKGGLFYTGDVSLLVSQVLGIVVTVVIVLMLDLVIAAVVKALFHGSLRVDEADEALGLMRASTARARTPRSPDSISSFPGSAPCRSIVARLSGTRPCPSNRRLRTEVRGAPLSGQSRAPGKPASLNGNSFLLIKRGIYYEENYGDRS